MTSYFTSDGVVYPSYRNCYSLGNHWTYFGFLSVSSTTRLSYTGGAATTDGNRRLLIINSTVKPSKLLPPYNGHLSAKVTIMVSAGQSISFNLSTTVASRKQQKPLKLVPTAKIASQQWPVNHDRLTNAVYKTLLLYLKSSPDLIRIARAVHKLLGTFWATFSPSSNFSDFLRQFVTKNRPFKF